MDKFCSYSFLRPGGLVPIQHEFLSSHFPSSRIVCEEIHVPFLTAMQYRIGPLVQVVYTYLFHTGGSIRVMPKFYNHQQYSYKAASIPDFVRVSKAKKGHSTDYQQVIPILLRRQDFLVLW